MKLDRQRHLEAEREGETIAESLAVATAIAGRSGRGLQLEEHARHFAIDLVVRLGFEHVAIALRGGGRHFEIIAGFSQSARFSDSEPPPLEPLLPLLRRASSSNGILRWGTPGPGRVLASPPQLGGEAVGGPLRHAGSVIGAFVATDIVPRAWSAAQERAFEAMAQIAGSGIGATRLERLATASHSGLVSRLAETGRALKDERIAARRKTGHLQALEAALLLSSRSHETFFGLLSHELRTPLHAVLGYLEILTEEWADGFPALGARLAEHRHILGRATAQAQQLHRLVDDLLFVGDALGNRTQLKLDHTDFKTLLGRVAGQFDTAGQCALHPARPLQIILEQVEGPIFTDRHLLERTLLNLFLDFAERQPGPIRMHASSSGPDLLLRLEGDEAPGSQTPARQAALLSARFRLSLVRAGLSRLRGQMRLLGPNGNAGAEIRLRGALQSVTCHIGPEIAGNEAALFPQASSKEAMLRFWPLRSNLGEPDEIALHLSETPTPRRQPSRIGRFRTPEEGGPESGRRGPRAGEDPAMAKAVDAPPAASRKQKLRARRW